MNDFLVPGQGKVRSRRTLPWASLVFLLSAIFAAGLIWNQHQYRLRHERAEVSLQVADYAQALGNAIEHALSVTYAMAALVRHGQGTVRDFDKLAGELLPSYPGASVLILAPDGIIGNVVPLAGNEKAIGLNLLEDPVMKKEATLARDTGKLVLAGPLNLVQGGVGVIGRLPVFLDHEGKPAFWGFTNVVMRLPEALAGARLQQLVDRGFEYELWRIHPDTAQKQLIAASASAALIDPVDYVLDLPYGKWTLSAAPRRGWNGGLWLSSNVALGLLFSLLLAFVAKLLIDSRAHEGELETQVVQRTADILASKNQLAAMLEAIPDPMWELGLDGRCHGCHSWRVESLATLMLEMIGHTVCETFPPAAADTIMAALSEAHANGSSHGKEIELRLAHARLWFELSVASKTSQPGEEDRFIVLARDITERKRAETDLRIAATAFESQEGMLITDANNVILQVNRTFTEMTGYTAEEAIGHTPRLIRSDRHDSAFYTAMWETLRANGVWQGEIWNQRKNGEVFPSLLTITAVKGHAGTITHYVGSQLDITERKAAEEKIEHLAYFDALTELPNRRLQADRLQQAVATSARSKKHGALLFLDLDNFKTLNDTLGHEIGDLLLQQVAQRLVACVRKGDTVARLGGDEFVVILEGLSGKSDEAAAQTETIGEKIRDTLSQAYAIAGQTQLSTPSIGVTLFAGEDESIDELMKRADLALYQAKAAGRNTLRFFDPDMQTRVLARARLDADLREAILQEQFVLHYQPQVDATAGVIGAEALLRWQHPRRGMVLPAEFIPRAEDTGMILTLGHWALKTAIAQLVVWAARPETAHLVLAVNVSVHQFAMPDFVEDVLTLLDQFGADPRKLKLELTESLLMENADDVIAKMTALKARGVSFSLDDFGTGYSSLAYLKRLPLAQLKIDQSFVRDVATNAGDAVIANSIIALANSMGMSVIAEGVETEEHRHFLGSHGCQVYQGYLFSAPLPLEEFQQYLCRFEASVPTTP
ncbi:MAG: EAL domain-containing protein [Sulfuritalea sp.]